MHASWVGERSNQYSQSDDDSWEDLAIFGYELKYKINFDKKHPSLFLANDPTTVSFVNFSI
jgi:hypothetical protein